MDSRVRATLAGLWSLHYRHAPRTDEDVPPHVRAGSALRRWHDRWVVVQDDVRALALVEESGRVAPLLLPANKRGERTFDDDRGNKRRKLDLEAAVVLPDGRFLAFGSGATAKREQLVLVRDFDQVAMRDGRDLYAALRARPDFSAGRLNIEAALIIGDRLRLYQRATSTHEPAPNASIDLDLGHFTDWLDRGGDVPSMHDIGLYDLGRVDRASLGITDVAAMGDGRIAYLACAEATDDPVLDGEVRAMYFGVIENGCARQTQIVGPSGNPVLIKLEGIEAALDGTPAFIVVSDADDAATAAQLGRLDVAGL